VPVGQHDPAGLPEWDPVARSVGSGLGIEDTAGILQVGNVRLEQLTGLGVLIVGSPTRGFRPTEATTNLLKSIAPNGLAGVKITAFDTRIATADIKSTPLRLMVKIGGYAAKPMAELLVKKGGVLVTPPEGFFVEGEKGPLKAGELERAADWARRIQELCQSR
jgi:hypothetical protein